MRNHFNRAETVASGGCATNALSFFFQFHVIERSDFKMGGKQSTVDQETTANGSMPVFDEQCKDELKRAAAFAEVYRTIFAHTLSKLESWSMSEITILVLILLVVGGMIGYGTATGLWKTLLFGKSQADYTEVKPKDIKTTFDDVKGLDKTKAEIKKFVDYLKNPKHFARLGARLPKGLLLVGPPGTGKTLLARAVAGEAKVSYFRATGSDFEEMLVGQGAKRVRAARKKVPCVVFIDEIDSCGGRRKIDAISNQVLNQLLHEMDGFVKNEGVIVLAATSQVESLDPALTRPGRFDAEIHVSYPDMKGRLEIFTLYLSKVKCAADVDADLLARRTVGYSGADIENIVNRAALDATVENKEAVTLADLEKARRFVKIGPSKPRITDEQVNRMTAYHEAGHAVVAYYTPLANRPDRCTIIPHGDSLGYTAYLPAKEQYQVTKGEMLAYMDVSMGGRAAEYLKYGDVGLAAGAASDLKSANEIASKMVKEYGMSEKTGLLVGPPEFSASEEIRVILQQSYKRALALLNERSAEHERLTKALIEKETLDSKAIESILGPHLVDLAK